MIKYIYKIIKEKIKKGIVIFKKGKHIDSIKEVETKWQYQQRKK